MLCTLVRVAHSMTILSCSGVTCAYAWLLASLALSDVNGTFVFGCQSVVVFSGFSAPVSDGDEGEEGENGDEAAGTSKDRPVCTLGGRGETGGRAAQGPVQNSRWAWARPWPKLVRQIQPNTKVTI
jgi:hypothetical protein